MEMRTKKEVWRPISEFLASDTYEQGQVTEKYVLPIQFVIGLHSRCAFVVRSQCSNVVEFRLPRQIPFKKGFQRVYMPQN